MSALLFRKNNKFLISILFTSILIIPLLTINVSALYFDSMEDFSHSLQGDNNTEQWKSSQNIYYNVREEDGNRFMETAKAKHVDYLVNESVNNALMTEFSVDYKVKFIKMDSDESSLSFLFRASDISNAYCVRLRKNIVELLDMDIADSSYANLKNNRTVLDSATYKFTEGIWYEISIVSTLVGSPYKKGDGVLVRDVLNEVYVNGIKVIENKDYATWFIIGKMMFYSWNVNTYIDDIFINFNPEKYRPTGEIKVPEDFYKTSDASLIKDNSKEDNQKKEFNNQKNIPSRFRPVYIVAIILIVFLLSAIIFSISYTHKLKKKYNSK